MPYYGGGFTAGGLVLNPLLQGVKEVAFTTSTGTSIDLDCSLYNHFYITLSGSVTLTLAGPAASGVTAASVTIIQNGVGSHTVAFAGEDSAGAGGAVIWPNANTPVVTATPDKRDEFIFTTKDGNGNWYGGVGRTNM